MARRIRGLPRGATTAQPQLERPKRGRGRLVQSSTSGGRPGRSAPAIAQLTTRPNATDGSGGPDTQGRGHRPRIGWGWALYCLALDPPAVLKVTWNDYRSSRWSLMRGHGGCTRYGWCSGLPTLPSCAIMRKVSGASSTSCGNSRGLMGFATGCLSSTRQSARSWLRKSAPVCLRVPTSGSSPITMASIGDQPRNRTRQAGSSWLSRSRRVMCRVAR